MKTARKQLNLIAGMQLTHTMLFSCQLIPEFTPPVIKSTSGISPVMFTRYHKGITGCPPNTLRKHLLALDRVIIRHRQLEKINRDVPFLRDGHAFALKQYRQLKEMARDST